MQALTWNSGILDAYLSEATQLVKDLDSLLLCIKDAVGQSQGILQQWQRDVMFERKEGRVAGFEELGSGMRDLVAARHAAVAGAHSRHGAGSCCGGCLGGSPQAGSSRL